MNKPRRAPRRRVDGVLLLDKPIGLSSNAALQKVRWLLNAEKGGHTGTLDPLATGLLPLCFGEATKFSGAMLDAGKAYLATVRLGITTDTADAEGRVLAESPVSVSADNVLAILPHFTGRIAQVPPMYSALKRDGVPLYELARQGIEVERAERLVDIHGLEMRNWQGDRFDLVVDCSKGTYVRTLAADIGAALGCGAHLAALRRIRVGSFDIDSAIRLEEIEALTLDGRDALLLPADALLADLPRHDLATGDADRLMHGQAIPWQGQAGVCRLYGAGRFLGTGECRPEGWLKPKRLIVTG